VREGREIERKRAGDNVHLQRGASVAGGVDGVAAKWQDGGAARVARQQAAAAGLVDPRARGGDFIGRPWEPRHAGPGSVRVEAVPRCGWTRAQARV
jgi:hypothetical protein